MPESMHPLKMTKDSRDDGFIPVGLSSPYSATQIQPHPSYSDLELNQSDHYSVLNTSRTHLQPSSHTLNMYPPEPNTGPPNPSTASPPLPTPSTQIPGHADPANQAERAGIPGLPYTGQRNSSWDIFSGVKKFEHDYQEFDPRNASEAHLVFADGDVPNNKVSLMFRREGVHGA